ncbi:MAG: class B sortase [Parasporobacterium sp.]|nr:class B sortase [Parasporobacterium sp.]
MNRRNVRRHHKKHRRKSTLTRAANIISIVVIVLAACVLGLSVYKLINIRDSYQAADDAYAQIESVFTGEADLSDNGFYWDYDKLLEMCSDAVGYIYQKGVMSYPIVQAEDNDKYLRTLMNGEYNVAGTIFVDARYEEGMEGQYSIVYGHNMYNSGMFGTIPNYEEEDYYKEHPFFDIYIGYKHYRYYVFSAFVAEADGYVYNFDLNEGEYKQQFDRLRADGGYPTDVRELQEEDHVIVLSTCVNFHDYTYRNVVCLVRGEEVN